MLGCSCAAGTYSTCRGTPCSFEQTPASLCQPLIRPKVGIRLTRYSWWTLLDSEVLCASHISHVFGAFLSFLSLRTWADGLSQKAFVWARLRFFKHRMYSKVVLFVELAQLEGEAKLVC